ncbi:MAG: S8 family serine peptidase [Rubrobacter sp.]
MGSRRLVRSGWSLRTLMVLFALFAASIMVVFVASQARGQVAEASVIDRDENGAEYLSGELIVTYESDLDASPVGPLISGVEGVVEEALPAVDSQVVVFPEVVDESDAELREETLEEKRLDLESDPAVASADYNYLRETVAEPNDPLYSRQWYLEKISAPAAYSKTTTTSVEDGSRLAIVDTGADLDHPDLKSKIVASTNTTNTADTSRNADDTTRHGTHVAGIAAAATNNERGIAGVCPDCGLMIAKTEDQNGFITGDAIVKAINWSVDNDADVINISLAGEGAIAAEQSAVERATAAGVTVVAAAGNESTNVRYYPAAYNGVLGVSATTRQDARASYSNFGNWIDFTAPGKAYATLPGAYGTKNGTSMASPMVAGVAGLLAGENLNRSQIQNKLISTATDLGPSGRDTSFGYGRVNASAALSTEAPRATSPNTAPTVSNPNPKPGVRTKGRAITVAATVRDRETNLAKSNITLFVDNGKKGFDYNRSTDRLTRKITLPPGKHRVKIVARDGQGLSKTTVWSFTIPRELKAGKH